MEFEPINTPERIEEELDKLFSLTPEQRERVKTRLPDATDEIIDESLQKQREEARQQHLRNLESAEEEYKQLGIKHDCRSVFDYLHDNVIEVPFDLLRKLDDVYDALERTVRERDLLAVEVADCEAHIVYLESYIRKLEES